MTPRAPTRLLAAIVSLFFLSKCSALKAVSSRVLDVQIPVWVHAYARSGSSTVLSMVSEAFKEKAPRPVPGATALITGGLNVRHAPGRVFSLFEPCHKGDKLKPDLKSQGCKGLLLDLAQCKFDRIERLHGWHDSHSNTRGVGQYNPDCATSACNGADVVAFKTISSAGEHFELKEHALPVLEQDPRLNLVDIVRDPRAIYASWMSTFPFNDSRLEDGVKRNYTALTQICDSYAAGLQANHSKVHRVVFEQLVRDPESVMKDLYDFLKVPFGDSQRDWLNRTFNAKECPGVDQYIAPYSDCHTNATASLEKWRTVLLEDELQAFQNHSNCLQVAEAYQYPVS